MSMVKFSLVALNFGYDFVPEVHFLGHPVYVSYLSEVWFVIGNPDWSKYVSIKSGLTHMLDHDREKRDTETGT